MGTFAKKIKDLFEVPSVVIAYAENFQLRDSNDHLHAIDRWNLKKKNIFSNEFCISICANINQTIHFREVSPFEVSLFQQ